jgi:predicted AlkP superfamily pyrophosphatase or phosphodiesterase
MLESRIRWATASVVAGLVVAVAFLRPAASAGDGAAPPGRPRLVVLISIDQFRADYVTRYADLFTSTARADEPRGFRYLMERGAWYSDAHHDHYPLFTGPGHAVLVTGAQPAASGIVGNEWGDRATGERIYCVRDDASPIVGGGGMGISPKSLRVSTVGDELKIATGGRAKVWALSFKDRAAVLMGGHLADGAVWLDAKEGRWVSSRWYCRDGKLPAWAEAAQPRTAWTAAKWETDVPADALSRVWLPKNQYLRDAFALGPTFPHPLGPGPAAQKRDEYVKAYSATPLGNKFVLDAATALIDAESLGRDDVPDFLAINLSSNDYLGHAFGPDSPEVLAMTVETDRCLADFMDETVRRVPGGWSAVTFVVSSDHGVAPIPEAMKDAGFDAGRYDERALEDEIAAALGARVKADPPPGAPAWTVRVVEQNVYLDRARLSGSADEAAEIAADVLRSTPGIAAAFTRSDIVHGRLPPTDAAVRVAKGFDPRVSGDVVFVSEPFWLPLEAKYATSHGTPYAYDTSVPIFFAGCGVREPGRYRGRVSTLDIAATLADELGVLQPSGCEGRCLPHAGR